MFREPKLILCCPVGDWERWLWVMEPTLGHIYGKAFRISAKDRMLKSEKEIEKIKKDAYDEMIARSNSGTGFEVSEGSTWEAFQ